jgi:predicted signal transduction protein with EAL and GGDEF domain
VSGTTWFDGVHPDDLDGARTAMAALAAMPEGTVTFQARFRHADGSWRWLDVFSTNLVDEPSVRGVVSNARDITDSRLLQDRLHHQAHHDPLTGLANRSLFTERLNAAVDRPGRFGVCLIDLDDFKPINDTIGHHAGDAVRRLCPSRALVDRHDGVPDRAVDAEHEQLHDAVVGHHGGR